MVPAWRFEVKRKTEVMEQILASAANAPIDVDMNNFMAEVVEGSSQIPVIVQFWAPLVWAV